MCWLLPRPRYVAGSCVVKHSGAYATLSPEAVEEIMRSFEALPPVATMPYNARRIETLPALYGGGSYTSGGYKTMTIKISLLTIQKLLGGELSYADFAHDHEEIAKQLANATRDGRMLSDVSIERCGHIDDDWLVLKFGAISPDMLFRSAGAKNGNAKTNGDVARDDAGNKRGPETI
jgi:hypothetical protein